MKPVRALAIALFGYAAMLAPNVSEARDVQLSLPGISVRLPAPPIPIFLPPGVSVVHEEHVDYGRRYEPEYRRVPPPRYYREDWRHERWEHAHDDHGGHDHDRGGHDHDHDGWRR